MVEPVPGVRPLNRLAVRPRPLPTLGELDKRFRGTILILWTWWRRQCRRATWSYFRMRSTKGDPDLNMMWSRVTLYALTLPVWVLGLPASSTAQSTSLSSRSDTTGTLVLPRKDPGLQAQLDRTLTEAPFKTLVANKRLSIALVDLSDPDRIRYAGVDDDQMRYAASLPKIAIMLGVFDQIEKGKIEYTPALKRQMELMIRKSANRESSELIELIGFENIAATLQDPDYELYHKSRKGGLWVGKDYGGPLGRWKRDPINSISHGATARQVARFFVMLDRGDLVSPWASAEMKQIMSKPEIKHKFVLGLSTRPKSQIFRKSGTWKEWHSDGALVERDGKKYVAVALMESSRTGVLARLIIKLDDIIFKPGAGSSVATQSYPPPSPTDN